MKRIEPIVTKFPTAFVPDESEGVHVMRTTAWEERLTGWDYGVEGNESATVLDKINEIVDWINSKKDQLL